MALQDELSLSAEDILCMQYDLLDWQQWVNDMVVGKINSCKLRMFDQYKPLLRQQADIQAMTVAQAEAILNDDSACIQRITQLSGYQNRAQRDAAQGS